MHREYIMRLDYVIQNRQQDDGDGDGMHKDHQRKLELTLALKSYRSVLIKCKFRTDDYHHVNC